MELLDLFYQMLATGVATGGVVIAMWFRCAPNENTLKFDGVKFRLSPSVTHELTDRARVERPPLSFAYRLAA
jgi:hypothetical protein